MSEPKRFDHLSDGMWENSAGDYVLHSDYARLKAEVGELCEAIKLASEVGIKMADEVTRLKAEVERLRKAGDAMVELLCHMDVVMDMDSDHPEVEAWNAAKEGRPDE